MKEFLNKVLAGFVIGVILGYLFIGVYVQHKTKEIQINVDNYIKQECSFDIEQNDYEYIYAEQLADINDHQWGAISYD